MTPSPAPWVLQILPEGFGFPAPVYWVPVVLLLAGVAVLVYVISPPVTDWTVPALAPWIAVGATLHVMREQPIFPDVLAPLFGTPMVYLTTGAVTGVVWSVSSVLADIRGDHTTADRQMVAFGTTLVALLAAISLFDATKYGVIEPLWPVVGLFFATVLTGVVWVGISVGFVETATVTGKTGVLVLFAHILDGVSTAVGFEVLSENVTEQTPLSRLILEAGADIPVVGGGGLFVVVKLALAVVVLVAFQQFVEDSPRLGRLTLGFVAAVGLGPALHNVLLFTVWESVVPA
jgi:uncharacterized membrane protein